MRRSQTNVFILALWIVAGIGYFVPWVITPMNSLSLGAYDLAEWTSLHPIVRQTLPYLWTTFALRIPLAVLGILFVAYINQQSQKVIVALVCLGFVVIALFPPLEFFTAYRDDPNYIQQFTLALVTAGVGILTLMMQRGKHAYAILALLSLLGAVASVAGLYQAFELIKGFSLPVTVGLGALLTSLGLLVLAIIHTKKQSS